MRLLRWLAGVLVTLLAIAFAVANIGSVNVIWSPMHEPIEIPLGLICLAAFFSGFLAGGLFVWLKNVPVRLDRRRQRKQVGNLEQRLMDIEERQVDSYDRQALLK